jgi:adenylate cyclase
MVVAPHPRLAQNGWQRNSGVVSDQPSSPSAGARDSLALSPDAPVVVETFERPPDERPPQATIDTIAEALGAPISDIGSGVPVFDQFAWSLLAAGIPVLRVTLHVGTLHPQFLGTTITWWRDTGRTVQVMIKHDVGDAIPYGENPVRRVCQGRETLRRRLDRPDQLLDFSVLKELRERGGADYLALPIPGVRGLAHMVTFVTDRRDGFTETEVADLTQVAQRLAIVVDCYSQYQLTRNLLTAYLGERTGPKVLDGQIRRGTGMELTAVLWSSDLRGFTERSDRLPGERIITILNTLFDAQAVAIHRHGGEILKFVGDGLLAIFPIEGRPASEVARDAAAAAKTAIAAVARLVEHPAMADEPPLEIVIALHIGTVIYGNIGAADRLDFTVIGPAVNLVSRVETVAKNLNEPVVVTVDVARALGYGLRPLGQHALRGLHEPHELFALT